MYVKLYNRILDSSLALNRPLRHFFTDLLLCADVDGMVVMTKEAISKRTGADMEEVEWGLKALQEPDAQSLTPDSDGRRIVPLEGHGYGWKIVNFEEYRDVRSAAELRSKAKERARRYRERKAAAIIERSNPPGISLTKSEELKQHSEQEGDFNTPQRLHEMQDGVPPGTYDHVYKHNL
jgi:hypothetical protein